MGGRVARLDWRDDVPFGLEKEVSSGSAVACSSCASKACPILIPCTSLSLLSRDSLEILGEICAISRSWIIDVVLTGTTQIRVPGVELLRLGTVGEASRPLREEVVVVGVLLAVSGLGDGRPISSLALSRASDSAEAMVAE